MHVLLGKEKRRKPKIPDVRLTFVSSLAFRDYWFLVNHYQSTSSILEVAALLPIQCPPPHLQIQPSSLYMFSLDLKVYEIPSNTSWSKSSVNNLIEDKERITSQEILSNFSPRPVDCWKSDIWWCLSLKCGL